jgi:K+-transporting ATPase ATPase C chain
VILDIWRNLRLALTLLVLLGLGYSLVLVGIGQILFPYQANGSLIVQSGKVIGSALIGQSFTAPGYFHGRPSATLNAVSGKAQPYNADNSSGSNLGPTNPALLSEIKANIAALKGQVTGAMPANLVESSASGLDPEITLQSALAQVPAVAKATGLDPAELRRLVAGETEEPLLGIYRPRRVNVLPLNLALRQLEGR